MIRFRTVRRAARTVSDAVRSVVAPASLVRGTGSAAAPDPDGLYSPEEMPAAKEIEAAAALYAAAADEARGADRSKRKARKILDRLPSGHYGRWVVARVQTSRQTPDLDSIRATYKRLGLGEVPMRTCVASLRITEAAGVDQAAEDIAQLLVAA